MLNNIVMSRLYRAGSVPYVSTSGGVSNELNNTISRSSNGVFEGGAIGGQRELESRYFLLITCFATTMHLAPRFCCFGRGRWHGWNPWKVAKIRNPRWCVGIACCLVVEVQLGHAGAQARGDLETAAAKNKDMKESGIHVPESYFSKVFSNRCRYLVQPYRTLDTVNES